VLQWVRIEDFFLVVAIQFPWGESSFRRSVWEEKRDPQGGTIRVATCLSAYMASS
jgi:hypothetical protein